MKVKSLIAAVCCLVLITACAAEGGTESTQVTETTQAPATTEASPTPESTVPQVECRIGFSFGNTQSSIYPHIARYAKEQATERDCEIVEGAAGGDPAKQLDELEQWIASDLVDAIVLVPIGGAIDPLVAQANDAGIPVIGYASEIPGGQAAILWDSKEQGQQISEAAIAWIEENFGDDVSDFSYAIFSYDACGQICMDRSDTVKALLLDRFGVEPVAEGDAIAEDTGLAQAESMLQANPGLDMLIGVNDAGALGASRAFTQAELTQVFLGGMDGQPEALEAIAEGGIYRATSGMLLSDIGKAVANLPADILQTGVTENVIVPSTLINTPELAQQALLELEG